MYYIGIDAGGTKTKFSLFDENIQLITSIEKKSCHFQQVDSKEMTYILKTGIMELKSQVTKEITICFGLAGYGICSSARSQIESVVKEICVGYKYSICSDATSALYGALDNKDGIVVISGTGSIAISCENNVTKRCGGWGHHIGDEGSAFWIGKRLLELFSKQSDGRAFKSEVYHEIKNHFMLKSDTELVNCLRIENNRSSIASLCKVASKCKHDINVLKIFDDAAKEIALMVNTLDNEKFDTVSYIGGVFNSGESIILPLKKYLNKNLKLIAPKCSPEKGAIYYFLSTKIDNEDS